MLIYPAIDLLGGKAVRLYQGDYNKVDVFGDDPAVFAGEFAKAGAQYLHVVDLDGARDGKPKNFESIQKIAKATGMFVELGGGIRDTESVKNSFDAGIDRVILGTSALKDPDFTRAMVQQYGGKIAVGVDARDGKVAVEGWLDTSDVDSFAFCKEMHAIGVEHIIYTDISRDGTGHGANLEAYKRLSSIEGLHITASGGVSSLEDIKALKELGLYAAILGKALYTGAVDLRQAVEVAKR